MSLTFDKVPLYTGQPLAEVKKLPSIFSLEETSNDKIQTIPTNLITQINLKIKNKLTG